MGTQANTLRDKLRSDEFWSVPHPAKPGREGIVERLACSKGRNPTRTRLIRRLRHDGFIPCDLDSRTNPDAWEAAETLRPIFEALLPPGAYVAWKSRSWQKAKRPRARDRADRLMYMCLYPTHTATDQVTACFDPLTGIVYVSFAVVDLSKVPYCVRNVLPAAEEIGLVEDREP